MANQSPETPDIPVPTPSVWPFLVTVAIVLLAAGILAGAAISGIGLGLLFISIAGWSEENRREGHE